MTMALSGSLQLGVRGGHADAAGTGRSRQRVWMPLGARELRRGSPYPPATRNGGWGAGWAKERSWDILFRSKWNTVFLFFFRLIKPYVYTFYRMTSNQQWKSSFQSKITWIFLNQFSPFFWTRLLADLTNGFGLPKAAFSLYYCFVYKPPFFAFSSPVPALIL